MISIKNISLKKIEEITLFAKGIGNNNLNHNDLTESNTEKTVEAIIESYLSSCNENKVELTKYLVSLTRQEIAELIALYYFFSKLTYDNAVKSDEELSDFWELCNLNSIKDIDRLGLDTMIEYLKERSNLETILSTAIINLKK